MTYIAMTICLVKKILKSIMIKNTFIQINKFYMEQLKSTKKYKKVNSLFFNLKTNYSNKIMLILF